MDNQIAGEGASLTRQDGQDGGRKFGKDAGTARGIASPLWKIVYVEKYACTVAKSTADVKNE